MTAAAPEPDGTGTDSMPPVELEAGERDWSSPDGRHVYVIEIAPSLHQHLKGGVPEGMHAFYVGQTCKTPELRLAQHCLGTRRMDVTDGRSNVSAKAGKPFCRIVHERGGEPLRPRIDAWLRHDLIADIPMRLDRELALILESEVAARLEADGHWVHCN